MPPLSSPMPLFSSLWRAKIPNKIKFFVWYEKVDTLDCVERHSSLRLGPQWCSLWEALEELDHLLWSWGILLFFFFCVFLYIRSVSWNTHTHTLNLEYQNQHFVIVAYDYLQAFISNSTFSKSKRWNNYPSRKRIVLWAPYPKLKILKN